MAAWLIASPETVAQTIPTEALPSTKPAAKQATSGPTQRAAPIGGPTGTTVITAPPESIFGQDRLLGGIGGLRPALEQYGISIGVIETSEVLWNPVGGFRQGMAYEGVTQMQLGIDMEQAIGLRGGTFNVSALQIHGRSISFNNIGNLNTVSSFESIPATRLFELWYQQDFADGQVSVRVGQQSADQEFQLSLYAGAFVNASFGWPTLAGVDLRAGGPAFPLATPGVRLRLAPAALPGLTLLGGVYNGNPAGPGLNDPQVRNPSGTTFPLADGVFAIAEAQYGIDAAAGGAEPLPGTYKIGAWYNSKSVNDQRFADRGSLGRRSPANYGAYAIMDQLVWVSPNSPTGGLGVFARVTGAPGDRNVIDVFADAGLTYRAPFPGRVNDTAGLGIGYARVSRTGAARAGLPGVSGGETVVELTYQYQIAPWWQVQPDFQYVYSPGANAPDPRRPGRRISNAAVFGVRTAINF